MKLDKVKRKVASQLLLGMFLGMSEWTHTLSRIIAKNSNHGDAFGDGLTDEEIEHLKKISAQLIACATLMHKMGHRLRKSS